MRLGILGGTFDPVHYGHLLLAESCREQCRLDAVWFLPSNIPPHKRGRELTPAEPRIEMLELAIGGHEAFGVSRLETDRAGTTYSVDTLAQFRSEQRDRELFFLLGADAWQDLPNWREPARICELATPVIVRRPGAPPPQFDHLAQILADVTVSEIRRHQVHMPQVDLSSREIRRRVAAGLSIRYRTPRAVEMYIRTAGLYTGRDQGQGTGGGPPGPPP